MRKRIRDSSDKAAQHLAHALGESVAGGNPGIPYAFSHPVCITSRCPYKLTYFPGYSLIAIQKNSWVGYPGILQRADACSHRLRLIRHVLRSNLVQTSEQMISRAQNDFKTFGQKHLHPFDIDILSDMNTKASLFETSESLDS